MSSRGLESSSLAMLPGYPPSSNREVVVGELTLRSSPRGLQQRRHFLAATRWPSTRLQQIPPRSCPSRRRFNRLLLSPVTATTSSDQLARGTLLTELGHTLVHYHRVASTTSLCRSTSHSPSSPCTPTSPTTLLTPRSHSSQSATGETFFLLAMPLPPPHTSVPIETASWLQLKQPACR